MLLIYILMSAAFWKKKRTNSLGIYGNGKAKEYFFLLIFHIGKMELWQADQVD